MAIRQGRHSVSAIGYGAAVLSSLDGHAALLDSEGTIVAVNEAWDRFGVENEALLSSIGVGVNYTEVCRRAAAHSESARAVLDGLRSVLNGTTPIFRCDYRCDGPETLRWFRLTVTPWRAPGGRVLVLHKDVSEERSLAEIQSRTLKSVGAIVWNADAPSFRTTFLAGQIEEILEFPSQTWLDDPDLWKKRIHAEDREWVLDYSSEEVQEGRNHEFDYRILAADGRTIWLRQAVNLVRQPGQPLHLAGISFDITELKHTQGQLQILGGRILKAQDEERSRIARELHDDIGQRLAFVTMDLGRLENTKTESVTHILGAIAEVKTQVSEISRDIAALAHDLHSHVLDSRGLVSASDEFCREVSARRNVSVKFRSESMPAHVPDTTSLALFRVLQEALQNAAKHSGATAFEVTLVGFPRSIELCVKDDGQGFDPKEALKGRGLGLTGMEERVKLLGGDFSIHTRPSGGTIIRARVPINSESGSFHPVPQGHAN
jgi:signal transduction histidine kinase